MSVLAENDIASLLKRGEAASNGILVFGNDEAGIAAVTRKIVASFSADEEPLHIPANSLRDDPTQLEDAFKAMSLLGGRRLILVEGCEETHARFLEPVIGAGSSGNIVVMRAGNLTKTSKLREAATAASRFHVVAVYEDTPQAVSTRVLNLARQQGAAFAEGAVERFLQLAGSSRGQVESEFEKLLLYCWPSKSMTRDDVEASCGEQASFDVDVLSSAILDGDLETCDRIFEAMRADGDWKQVLILLQMQFARLENIRAEMAGGSDMERAFRSAKPPVFFAQQKTIARQLKTFTLEDLNQFGLALQTAILASRQLADLAEAVVSRAILSMARKAQHLRQRQI